MTIIRNYRSDDLEACRGLWVELTDWHRQIYDSPGIGGDQPGLQFDEHLEAVGPNRIWVAEVDNKLVGMTGMIVDKDGGAELEPVVLLESHRGQGIGRALVDAVVAAAKENGMRELTVRPVGRNAAAIRFFHELGFDVIGKLELFMDFRPREKQGWISEEEIAERPFRV